MLRVTLCTWMVDEWIVDDFLVVYLDPTRAVTQCCLTLEAMHSRTIVMFVLPD